MTDVLLNDDGDLPRDPQLVNDHRVTVQRARAALGLFQGEWLPDRTAGLPWLKWLRQTPLPLGEIEAATRAELAGVTGVAEVRGFAAELDRDEQILQFEGQLAEAQTGEELRVSFTLPLDPHEFHPIFTTNQLT